MKMQKEKYPEARKLVRRGFTFQTAFPITVCILPAFALRERGLYRYAPCRAAVWASHPDADNRTIPRILYPKNA